MTEQQAIDLAATVGGEPYHSGGGIWLVLADRPDGTFRVISEDIEAVYPSRAAWERGDEPTRTEAI